MSQITHPICGITEFRHTFLHTSKARVMIQRQRLHGLLSKQNNELMRLGSEEFQKLLSADELGFGSVKSLPLRSKDTEYYEKARIVTKATSEWRCCPYYCEPEPQPD